MSSESASNSSESRTRLVPPEIIHQVYKHFARPFMVDGTGHSIIGRFPWFLGQICSRWRTVFLSMHEEFWSEFMVVQPSPFQPVRTLSLGLTEAFLHCKQDRPFSFIYAPMHTDSVPILQLLVSQSMHWESASFSISQVEELDALSGVKTRVPLLRSFKLVLERESSHVAIPENLDDIFQIAPRLTHVCLERPERWCFDWSILTNLGLMRCNGDSSNLLRLLSRARHLERLVLEEEPLVRRSEILITMPHLRTLEIAGVSLLSTLKTPALKKLRIYLPTLRYHYSNIPVFATVCRSFFDRSSCQLQHLALQWFTPADVATILPFTTAIHTLTLDPRTHHAYKDYFHLLTFLANQQQLIPRLRKLRVVVSNHLWNDDVMALEDVISSRKSSDPEQFRTMVWYVPVKGPSPPPDQLEGVETRIESFRDYEYLGTTFFHGDDS